MEDSNLGGIKRNHPCKKDCKDRTSECRLTCDKFKKWQKDYEKLREEIHSKKEIDSLLVRREMLRHIFKIRRNK